MLNPWELSQLHELFQRLPAESVARQLEQTVETHGEDARVWFMLGAARHRQGKLAAALTAFEKTLELAPDHVQALNAKGGLLVAAGRAVEARSLLEQSCRRFPQDASLRVNLGYLLEQEEGGREEALACYDAALNLVPTHRAALMNRGALLCLLGRFGEAVENNRRLARVVPMDAVAHFNLADSLLANGNYEECLVACDHAIELDKSLAKAYIDRALANIALGRVETGERDLTHVRKTNPVAMEAFQIEFAKRAGGVLHQFDTRSLYLHLLYAALAECNWARWDEFVHSLDKLILETSGSEQEIRDPNLPFRALGFPIRKEACKNLSEAVARGVSERASRIQRAPFVATRKQPARIRLGYISPDYRRHPGAYLTRRMYGLHDRERFEVFAYSLYPDDGSEVRRDIEAGCDVFRDVSALDPGKDIDLMRQDEIDVAIDLSGYTSFTRSEVFACRVALVQVSYLGFPGSLGAEYMDYAIVDHVACLIGEDAWWKEKLVRLPHSYHITNNKESVDVRGLSRSALGLPESGLVFCCFNNPYKIDPATFDLWMKLLQRVKGSVLWLFKTNDAVEGNLRREASKRDVNPGRLIFAPRTLAHEKHLGRYSFADVFLDTRYYNAHTTAIDALCCSVPVITVPGETMASRVGASLLHAIGLPELICKDWAEYEEKVVWLATHPEELAALKRKLATNRDSYPLFDTEGQVRALEAAYEEMWRRHQAGLPPAAFDVKPLVNRKFRNAWH